MGSTVDIEERLQIALIGTRGVPARYGGFETAAEEIGSRLVERGHRVRVYCRGAEEKLRTYRGMELVHLPAPRLRAAETLGHTALSVLHLQWRRPDVAFVFNAANAPLLPLVRLARVPFATHVDGLEWKRAKWGPMGRRYYLVAERLAVRWSRAIIADAEGIRQYYRDTYGADSELIAYGAPIIDERDPDVIREVDVEPRRYHLVVARFEPENNLHVIIDGYRRSGATHPLVVVGSAPYAERYTAQLHELARGDERIRFLGGIWNDVLLDQLYANALTYLHGHSVGGTNPSLLRAMGASAAVLAIDGVFSREVAGECGQYFRGPADVAALVERAEQEPEETFRRGARGAEAVAAAYDWETVADEYERLARRLARDRRGERRQRAVPRSG